MTREFVIAKNSDLDSSLPYLIRLPLPDGAVVLKVRESGRTARQARPNVTLPTARAAGQVLDILVDSHERYAWTFNHQQATTTRRPLPAGDDAVELDGRIVATVERKSLADLVSPMTSGKLRYVLADLAAVPNAAVVIEDRFPSVPIVFAGTRPRAQEWTFRFLGAALAHHHDHDIGTLIERSL